MNQLLEATNHEYTPQEEVKTPGKKNIYKKTLAMELIRRGNDLHHTMRNKYNAKYQVFVFDETPKLIDDLLQINRQASLS